MVGRAPPRVGASAGGGAQGVGQRGARAADTQARAHARGCGPLQLVWPGRREARSWVCGVPCGGGAPSPRRSQLFLQAEVAEKQAGGSCNRVWRESLRQARVRACSETYGERGSAAAAAAVAAAAAAGRPTARRPCFARRARAQREARPSRTGRPTPAPNQTRPPRGRGMRESTSTPIWCLTTARSSTMMRCSPGAGQLALIASLH
jgi:hypothetical protein